MENESVKLPEPDTQAKQRSEIIKRHILQACELAGGGIRFSEFMNIALYEPGLGYYSGGLQKFGAKGDFITSPELSPLFGQCLANQIAEVLQAFDNARSSCIIEFGAGSGLLATEVLLRLETLGVLPERYLILELSTELKQRQYKTLEEKALHLLDRVQWLDQLPDDVDTAVVIANEVLDAMPVEYFRVVETAKYEGQDTRETSRLETLMVKANDNQLEIDYQSSDDSLLQSINSIERRSGIELYEGYCSEHNPAIKGWLAAMAEKIPNLVLLLIDYGYNEKEYYQADRSKGTLMCYYQHRAHDDYLWWPGLQDITAFVNFSEVAYCADDTGIEVAGYTTQAAFLLANGLSELHAEQVTDDARQQIRLSQQIKTLTLPSEMGERFKVMALTKNYNHSLTGFSMLDLRNRL